MDIFEVLNKIMERKIDFMNMDLNDNKAMCLAEFDVSKEYNIPIAEIIRLCRG